MSKFKTLSVAEDRYQSDRLTAAQARITSTRICGKYVASQEELRIGISTKRGLSVELYIDGLRWSNIVFENIDIDGLIQHLLEVKQFLSEEDMIARLLGTK